MYVTRKFESDNNKSRPKDTFLQMSDFASLSGSSLTGSISLQRSYGATRADFNCTDTKVLLHRVAAGDSLQGLAIRYGVAVEKIKRLNKLWSNESLFLKDMVKIPCAIQPKKWQEDSDDEEFDGDDSPRPSNVIQHTEVILENLTNPAKREEAKSEIKSQDENRIDCNLFLNDIDTRINKCKDDWAKKQNQHAASSHVPPVSYHSNDANKMSPTKQSHPFLERL